MAKKHAARSKKRGFADKKWGGRGFLNPFGRCRKQIIKNIL